MRDATRPGGTQYEETHATRDTTERLLTNADATERSLTQRNWDATERGDSDANSTQRRLVRTHARHLSDARNTHGGKTLDRGIRADHGFVNCGQARNQLTRNQNCLRATHRHPTPPDVLFAFSSVNSRAEATPRRKIGDYKKTLLDCGFRVSAAVRGRPPPRNPGHDPRTDAPRRQGATGAERPVAFAAATSRVRCGCAAGSCSCRRSPRRPDATSTARCGTPPSSRRAS